MMAHQETAAGPTVAIVNPAPLSPEPGEDLRDFIDEMAWGAGVNANTLRQFIELDDTAGAEYSLRCLIARLRALKGAMITLRDLRNRVPVEEPLRLKEAA
jgi:hypothetical protein